MNKAADDMDLMMLRQYWTQVQTTHLLAALLEQSKTCYSAPRAPTRAAPPDAGVFTNDLSAGDLGDGLQDLGGGCYRHLVATNSDGECPDPYEE